MVSFLVESWIWYAVVLLVALSRFVSRRMALGSFKAYQADEYVMLLAIAFYTALIVTINIVDVTSSNLLPPGYDVAHMTQADIDERTYGSKLILVVEESQCTVVWAAKACLLIMYLRLTSVRRGNLAVKLLIAYVMITFAVMEILYLAVWCRPFTDYWAVPTPNVQCDAATNHLITNAVFNLTSDIAMLAIGLPMFLRMTLPLSKKIPVVGVFSLGVFVIVSSVLNKIYSFTNPFGEEWVFWYVRESSTAIIVANLPFVSLLYRRLLGLSNADKEIYPRHSMHSTPSPRDTRQQRGSSGAFTYDPNIPYTDSVGSSTHKRGADSVNTFARSDRDDMTAEEMLRADYYHHASGAGHGVVDPYTHPALFFGSRRQQSAAMDMAVLRDRGRDEAGDPGILSATPASVNSGAERSLGSFV